MLIFELDNASTVTETATAEQSETAAEPTSEGEQPGPSGEGAGLTIDGIPIPDGVDPSFLEALPESIRREVLAEQLGLHPPVPPRRDTTGNENEGNTDLNVSPEFLAALPPDVQEEVCAIASSKSCKHFLYAIFFHTKPEGQLFFIKYPKEQLCSRKYHRNQLFLQNTRGSS